MQSLNSLFQAVAESKGEGVLFADESGQCSGDQARDSVRAIAANLVRLRLRRGDRVAFLCDNSVRYALAFFACLQLGVMPCALHVRVTARDMARTIRWLDASAVIVDSKYRETLLSTFDSGKLDLPLFILDQDESDNLATGYVELSAPAPGRPGSDKPELDEPAMIILSSGTTGAPKGVVHSQRTLYASAMAGGQVFGDISTADSVIIAMAPSFAAWNHVLFPFLARKAKIVFIRSFDAGLYLDTIARETISHAALVPTAWRRVLSVVNEGRKIDSLRSLFFSGEPATADFIESIRTTLPDVEIRTGYLSSEGGDGSAFVADNALLASGKLCVGKAVDGAGVRIVDPGGTINDEIEVGETGEILVSSDSLALGYWDNPELTAERFVDGWWRSSDLGCLDEEGNLSISGRNDNLIITGGLKVHAEEIEAALTQHEAIDIAAVVGRSDEQWGQRVEAFVIANSEVSEDDILRYCRDEASLPSFKVPKKIHFRDKLPTGSTGKLYRRGLLEDTK